MKQTDKLHENKGITMLLNTDKAKTKKDNYVEYWSNTSAANGALSLEEYIMYKKNAEVYYTDLYEKTFMNLEHIKG